MTEKTWRICGQDTLDLLPVAEPGNPWNGTIPVTPVMDTQLDEIVIRALLMPLQKRILTELKDKINPRRRGD